MTILGKPVLCASAAALMVAGAFGARHATALTPAGELASHRAIYELTQ